MSTYVEDVAHAISYIEEHMADITEEDEEKYFTNSIRDIQDDLSDLKHYFNDK